MNTLGERLKILRAKKGREYTQQRVADELKISQATYSSWEVERNEPSINWLVKLANYYNTSLEYLLRGDEEDSEFKSAPAIEDRVTAHPLGFKPEALKVAGYYNLKMPVDSVDSKEVKQNFLKTIYENPTSLQTVKTFIIEADIGSCCNGAILYTPDKRNWIIVMDSTLTPEQKRKIIAHEIITHMTEIAWPVEESDESGIDWIRYVTA